MKKLIFLFIFANVCPSKWADIDEHGQEQIVGFVNHYD